MIPLARYIINNSINMFLKIVIIEGALISSPMFSFMSGIISNLLFTFNNKRSIVLPVVHGSPIRVSLFLFDTQFFGQ